jgi:hypothetical protein
MEIQILIVFGAGLSACHFKKGAAAPFLYIGTMHAAWLILNSAVDRLFPASLSTKRYNQRRFW